MLRRLRGLLGIAIVWALAFAPIGLLVGVYRALTMRIGFGLPPWPLSYTLRFILYNGMAWGIWGAASGLLFGLILSISERRRTVADLRVQRTAIWGALGAMVLPAAILGLVLALSPGFNVIVPALTTLGISAALGATCASGTLLLARRAKTEALPPGDA